MIRFHCPLCGKTLEVPKTPGAMVVCPLCNERSVAPLDASRTGAEAQGSEHEACRQAVAPRDKNQGLPLFARMSRRLRWAVALVAGVGVFSLVLAVLACWVPALGSLADKATCGAVILVPASIVSLLVILHGHGTGCPSCGKWWARRKTETEFVDREVFNRDGVPFARATYRTGYECSFCRHRWAATSTDEYREFIRQRKKQRSG
jgi:hypothetical protein